MFIYVFIVYYKFILVVKLIYLINESINKQCSFSFSLEVFFFSGLKGDINHKLLFFPRSLTLLRPLQRSALSTPWSLVIPPTVPQHTAPTGTTHTHTHTQACLYTACACFGLSVTFSWEGCDSFGWVAGLVFMVQLWFERGSSHCVFKNI